MEGGRSNGLLNFGGDGGGGCLSSLMIMPLMASASSSHPHQPPNTADHNNIPLPLPPPSSAAAAAGEDYDDAALKAKIMSHPHYPRLLSAYVSCQKVGAPAEVVARLEEACASSMMIGRAAAAAAASSSSAASSSAADPALDQFMEAYCEMLTKYEQELSKPFKEAMLFLSRIDAQFKSLSLSPPPPPPPAAGASANLKTMKPADPQRGC